jgi:outer membrane biosynthesis protein TonB
VPQSSEILHSARLERARRPLLLKGLALSVALHVAFLALWPEGASPPPRRVVLLYPDLIRPARVEPIRMVADPEPAGGSAAGSPAPPAAARPAEASIAPPDPAAAPDDASTIRATPRPVARATPTPPRVSPPGPTPATGTTGTGVARAGEGGGAGTGGGAGDDAGSGAGPGDGGGGWSAPAEPDESPRLVTFPLPVNTPETERGELRGRARVEVVVDETGRVVDARITQRLRLRRGDREEPVEGFPAAVDRSVLDAARRLRFRPARLAGAAVRAVTTVTLSVGV